MIEADSLSFTYPNGPSFSFPELRLDSGEALLILGQSGTGKSTWIQLLSGIRRPGIGKVYIENQDLSLLSNAALDQFRAQKVGFVFQNQHFVPSLNAFENLMLPFSSKSDFPVQEANRLIDELGLGKVVKRRPYKLSQGEQQRLGIIRAILHRPSILFADEPSSSLDDGNCEIIISLLKNYSKEANCSLIVVTHDQRIKNQFERRIEL